MAEFNQEQAIRRFTNMMTFIHAGAYQERDHEGNYAEDGIEKTADDLIYQAAQHGLEFRYHKEENRYSLEPLSAESKAAFLHVNVEKLVSLLAETARYVASMPYESALDKSYRTGLHERMTELLEQSYLVPVLREDMESIEQRIQEINEEGQNEWSGNDW